MPRPSSRVPPQNPFFCCTQLRDRSLTAFIAHIDRELNANRAGIEGVVQHQQLRLGVYEGCTSVGTEECGSDFNTTVLESCSKVS